MIIEEFEEINGIKFIVHYSDKGVYVLKQGTSETYEKVYDFLPCEYTYVETDKKLPVLE